MPGTPNPEPGDADLVLLGGRVFTANEAEPFVSALAVTDGRISAVGGDELEASVGPTTELIRLQGVLVTPGFTDAHVHTATSGLEQLRLNFDDCLNAEEAYEAIAGYVEGHEEGWIIGGGWSQAWFERGCPDAASLDRIVGDRPALLMNADGHGAWASSRALEMAGIESETPDPADGRIERNRDGSPQGTLHEGAINLVRRFAPDDTVEDFVMGLMRGQEEMLRFGITSWQEAAVTPPVQEAYLRVAGSGRLAGDVVGALWWDRERGLDQIDDLARRRERSAPGFRPTSVKLMLDGVAENFTASVLDSYLDDQRQPTGNLGVDFIDPDLLKEVVTRLDRLGFQCHFHALGDRAVRNALDALEVALKANGPNDLRHHLAHIQFVHPDDVPRFAHLGAYANAQPLWACNDEYQIELTKPFITAERYGWQYPFGSLLRSGAKIGMGSDWNVSTANVMEEIDVAVTRTGSEGGSPLGPNEAISAAAALTAFTMGSAMINHSEGERGSLEVGKAADFVVFDRDPLVEGPLRGAKVSGTYIDGRQVYSSV
ncbi:MAG: amidohydrolase [Actinobacteria bacterium]|mgnify:FL=1|nr:MAG: amidohydrolase [Actinomycetota bacterium]